MAGTFQFASGGSWTVGGLVGLNSGTISNAGAALTVNSCDECEVGGLVGVNGGTISASNATGALSAQIVGGLAAENPLGTIENSWASTAVTTTGTGFSAGGLVSGNDGTISQSFATGTVSASATGTLEGGLVGDSGSALNVSNCYATGSVTGKDGARLGGLIGRESFRSTTSTLQASYSTGLVTGGANGGIVGGFIGLDDIASVTSAYWDTTTSGITNSSQGAGSPSNAPGITGLTTTQLQSGLPSGFDPGVWAENPGINNGLPYLIANPPPN